MIIYFTNEGTKEGKKEGRKEGRKDGRMVELYVHAHGLGSEEKDTKEEKTQKLEEKGSPFRTMSRAAFGMGLRRCALSTLSRLPQ